jgi:hypothetical protein
LTSLIFQLDVVPSDAERHHLNGWLENLNGRGGVAVTDALKGITKAGLFAVRLFVLLCIAPPVQAAGDVLFTTSEMDGSKIWEGGGTIDLKGPVTLKVRNTMPSEHGIAIDTMKVKEVIKPGEEKAITVPLENIDKTVSEHKVYCQLHPKHIPAKIKVAGK